MQQRSAQNRLREQKQQVARSKKYHNDFHVQHRARLMRARTKEERVRRPRTPPLTLHSQGWGSQRSCLFEYTDFSAAISGGFGAAEGTAQRPEGARPRAVGGAPEATPGPDRVHGELLQRPGEARPPSAPEMPAAARLKRLPSVSVSFHCWLKNLHRSEKMSRLGKKPKRR